MSIVKRNHEEQVFVNRESELEELERAFNSTKAGRGVTVFLEGEAGVGKTALFDHFSERLGPHGARILRGRCLYKDDVEPYMPFIDALEPKKTGPVMRDCLPVGLIGLRMEEEKEESPDIPVGLFNTKDADSRILDSGNVEQERERMFNSVRSSISNLAHSKPVVFFIDDLQWADRASLQLLHYIARHVRQAKVMLVCAFRPEELSLEEGEHGLLDIFRRMNEEKLSTTIRVNRMGRESISAIVQGMLEAEDIPDTFINKVYSESEGNPYFVVEVIKSLCEEGVIDPTSHVWSTMRDIEKLSLPGGLMDIVSRRVAKLDYKTKKILMHASAIGSHFEFKILQRALEMDEEELLDVLDQLIEMHLIIEEPSKDGEVFRFDHVQIRQVVYDGLSRSRARVMHKKIGELIEQECSDRLGEVVYILARHFHAGQIWEKGFKYSLMAGESAQSLFAFDEAQKYYLQSVECLERLGNDFSGGRNGVMQEKALLYLRLGELAYGSGRFLGAIEFHKSALELSKKLGDRGLEAEASCRIGLAKSQKGDYKDAEKDLDRALDIFTEENQHLSMALANRGLGYCHWRAGELDDALAHYAAAVESAQDAGDSHLLGTMYIDIGNVHNHRGDFENGLKYYNMAIEELEQVKDYSEIARAYNNIGDVHIQMEKWDTAIEYLDKSVQSAKKIH
ncbi:MAG TPA: tetratricopeptide repeat protein, partial [Euryarchaeota archaeon]|nr:tetratricopeptide repeat protein [Euryarchaeota archaeon]